MRQTILAADLVPGPASEELLGLVEELRPWANEDLVVARLRAWADRHWGPCSLTPGVADGAAEVAAVLCLYGRAIDPPDEVTALWVTFAMLRRVARKRPPTGIDPITDYVKMYPASTTRRWIKTAAAGFDDGGLALAFKRIQGELDLGGLVAKSYTLPNARAWLRRNPGKHAFDAPPPRRRRRCGTNGPGGDG
jgi:hypothetical protein